MRKERFYNRLIAFIVAVAMIIATMPLQAVGVFAYYATVDEVTPDDEAIPVGDGTTENPYQISNVTQLYWFAGLVNGTLDDTERNTSACAELTNDITVNEKVLDNGELISDCSSLREWAPMGSQSNPYKGTFKGDEYTISGLYYDNSSASYVGLFGYSGGTIENVGVVDSYFNGETSVGGICGFNNGTITKCYSTGNVNGSDGYVGGICGFNNEKITECYSTGNVSGSELHVGGICGFNLGAITECYSKGNVSGRSRVGGISGTNDKLTDSVGTVTDCYSTANVSGVESVGGISGYSLGSATNCYSTGSVSGNENVGGIFGYSVSNITNCYSTGSVSGAEQIGGVCGCNAPEGSIISSYSTSTVTQTEEVENTKDTEEESQEFPEELFPEEIEEATGKIGGICGKNYGKITVCYSVGKVIGIDGAVGGICGFFDTGYNGSLTNNYYLKDTASVGDGTINEYDGATSKSKTEFTSGEVCYLLNNCSSSDDVVWRQTLSGNGDVYPVLDETHGVVYKIDGKSSTVYSNSSTCTHSNYDKNGICDVCGNAYEPAKPNAEGYYEIDNMGKLYWFAEKVNDGETSINAILVDNITVNNNVLNDDETLISDVTDLRPWIPIGYNTTYSGTFNGNGKTISGIYFNKPAESNVGLFGSSNGTIDNVGVVDSYINGSLSVGGICGSNGGYITNSYTKISISGNWVGGICGSNNGQIINDYTYGLVTGTGNTGGICGVNFSNNITDCYSSSTIISKSGYAGGISGGNRANITNCYSTGSISGASDWVQLMGGICGVNYENASVTNSYAIGSITGSASEYVGSICGRNGEADNNGVFIENRDGTLKNNYYLEGIVNVDCKNICVFDGTTAKTAEQFASGEVCYLLNNESDENSVVWKQTIGSGEYPSFVGEIVNAYDATNGKLYGNNGVIKSADSTVTAADITTLGNVTVNKDAFASCGDVVVYVNDGDITAFDDNVTKKYVVGEDGGVRLDTTSGEGYKFSVIVDTTKFGGTKGATDFLEEVDVIANETTENNVTEYTEDGDDIEFKVDYSKYTSGDTVRGQVQVKKWANAAAEKPIDDVIYYVTKIFTVGEYGTIS